MNSRVKFCLRETQRMSKSQAKNSAWQRLAASHWLRFGLPFVTFCVLGSVGLASMLQSRLAREDSGRNVQASAKYDQGKAKPAAFSLEAELERMQRKVDISRWENKPVPELPSHEDKADDEYMRRNKKQNDTGNETER